MADDNILAAFSGLANGLSSTIVPMMQEKYKSRLAMEQEARAREARKVNLPEGLAGELGIPSLPTDPEILNAATTLAGKRETKKKGGTHYVLGPDGKVVNQFASSEGTGDTITRLDTPKPGPGGNTAGLTPGQIAVDKNFAKDYEDFVTAGGYSDVQKNVKQLKQAATSLGKTDSATGPLVGLVPKIGRDIISPEGASIQDSVEEVVQRNLRLVLGAQFTENEGKQLLARVYNPRQPESVNKARVERLANQIAEAAKAKAEAGDYFEEHGTLKGFKGKLYRSTDDFLTDMKDQAEKNSGKGGMETPSLGGSAGAAKSSDDIFNEILSRRKK